MKEFIEIRKGFSIAKNLIVSFWCDSNGLGLDAKGVTIIYGNPITREFTDLYSYNELKALLNGEGDYITK